MKIEDLKIFQNSAMISIVILVIDLNFGEWLYGLMTEWLNGLKTEWLNDWMTEWLNGLKTEWLNGLKTEWLNGWITYYKKATFDIFSDIFIIFSKVFKKMNNNHKPRVSALKSI